MKLVYLGTPDMAVAPLRALADAGHEIVLVVTRVDKRRGRGSATTPSPVKAAALELGLAISHDVDDVLSAVRNDGAELGVVVAFGQIIKPHVLDVIPMVNLHFSLLPRWRGAAPVERALLAGDDITGVCVMALEEGLDTGGVYARREVPIGSEATAADLRIELVGAGTDLLVDTLGRPLAEWIDDPEPQTGEVTYAAKFASADFEIDWTMAPSDVHRLIRVGGAWTIFRGKRLKIREARLVDGRVVPIIVQPEGKAPMAFAAWRNGAQPTPDELFGDL
ncbi:MAG TPA: methionyl-tRNA formyltransferase [Ilumatobacteraceae bacterium]|nr:methionyl-tRNA formyltransferase [Ilumatobacteraceae bacterium]